MWILNKYILKTHVAPFIFGVVTVMFLFLFQFLMRYLDELLGKGLSNWVILQLIGLNLAWMFVLAVPLGVLFSTLMTFGTMGQFHEVTIIKASGGGLLKMMRPVMLMASLLTIFLFWFNDQVLPEANHSAKVLLNDITRKKPTFSLESGQFSTQLEGYTILSRTIDSVSGTLRSVTVYDNSRGRRSSVISADSGTVHFSADYNKIIMNLYSGEIHQFYPNSIKDYYLINFNEYVFITNASGFNFERSNENLVSRGDREMRISDMNKIITEAEKYSFDASQRAKKQIDKHFSFVAGNVNRSEIEALSVANALKSGQVQISQQRIDFIRSVISSDIGQQVENKHKADKYKVEIYKKYSIPFACFIFALIGCPLGVMTKGGNFGISASLTLAVYVIYWSFLIGGEKLADRDFLSPFLSMWSGNFFIGLIGIFLVLKVNNESMNIPGKKLFLNLINKFKALNEK